VPPVAGPLAGAAAFLDSAAAVLSRIVDWLAARALTPTSLAGAGLALGICAAAWLTAGTTAGNLYGVLAMCLGYLALLAARSLAARMLAGGAVLDGDRQVWVTRLAARAFDGLVVAGLAIDAATQGWAGMWQLGVSVLALVSVRETMTACSPASRPADGGPGRGQPQDQSQGLARRALLDVATMPAGGRVLLIAVVTPAWGARVALVGLLDWAIIAIGLGIIGGTVAWRRGRPAPAPVRRRTEAQPTSLAVLLQPSRPVEPDPSPAATAGREPISVLRMELATPPAPPDSGYPVGEPAPFDNDGFDEDEFATDPHGLPVTEDTPQPDDTQPDDTGPRPPVGVIVRCRDDGPGSRWFGRLVRGQLIPLPPALLALAAVAMLAHLGLRDLLPGLLILAPPIVMLVAAPGSSHRHDGRLDWLVPAVLLGAQFTYIAALGFAARVPAAVTLLLCAAIGVWYADLGSPWSPHPARLKRGGRLGWETRMLVCGLGAAVGLAMVAYLAVTAYLAVLICWKLTTGYAGYREVDTR
jgi:hypothetical protein